MKIRNHILAGTAALLTAIAGAGWLLGERTEADIATFRNAVVRAAAATPSTIPSAPQLAALPEPVRRWVVFTFPNGIPIVKHVEIEMQGQFRRPGSTGFEPTRASQTIAAGTPALLFAATTPIMPGIWARAYDAYVDGKMEMKAKILSALTVMDQASTPELDRISLRRWLLESPLYPVALLPGGPVRWEAIDPQRARAIATFRALQTSMVATFAADGRLVRFDAETDGDLNTPYHGSGEHTTREDYRLVKGMMIPHKYLVARAAGGRQYPFWDGRVTRIEVSLAAAAGDGQPQPERRFEAVRGPVPTPPAG